MQCNAYQGNVGSGTCHLTGQRILCLYFQFNFKTQHNPKRQDKSGNSKSLIIYPLCPHVLSLNVYGKCFFL